MVPEGWRLVSLGDCFEFKNGINADKDSYGHGVNFVNVMDVFASRELRYENLVNSVSVTDKQKKDYSVLRGDVLFNRTSEVVEEIAFASVYCDDEPAVFGGFVIRGRRKGQSISERFSVYLFGSSSFRRQAIKSCQGAVRGNIGQKDLAKISLYLPPLNEQKKIASILSTWDEAITTSERLIEASQQQRHALVQQLLTGKRRLPGFEGEWGKVELKEALDYQQPGQFIVKSTEYSNNYKTPVLTAGKSFVLGYSNEEDGVYDQGLPVIIFDDFTTASRLVGFPFKVKSSAIKILTSRPGFSVKYFFEAMQMIPFVVGGHQRHWISIFSNLVIPCPSFEEQKAIAEVLSQADAEIEAQQLRLDCLRQEKKALMQKLLTGKRRVKVEATAPTEEAAC